MSEFTLKYRLIKNAARVFKRKRVPAGTAEELREKYRKSSRIINFPERAWSPKLQFERRVESWGITTMLSRKDNTKALLYIPGGEMLKYPVAVDYRQFEELALKTGRDVMIPYFPLCPVTAIDGALEMVYEAYKHLVIEYGEGNVAVAGCSSGGTLALGLISHINAKAENVPMPEKLYVASPEMCFCSQAERDRAKELEKTDIALNCAWLDTYYGLLTDGKDLPDYMTRPQLGDYKGLGEAYVCFADCEVLYAMCRDLVSQMESAGVNVTLEKGRGLYHGYPVLNNVKDAHQGHMNMLLYLCTERGKYELFKPEKVFRFFSVEIRVND